MSDRNSHNLDNAPIFHKINAKELLLQCSLYNTITLVKKYMLVSKKRNKQNVVYPIEREPDTCFYKIM
jgi:hypothetical protein